ncbi:hypothetical protein [Streptomyces pinistramenti]|uniref:hypothetical protein n=1 Tax=Streptomyces pinistramenti TaxID=2884812 RepID=UPI001D07A57B|nr:hypothetical protein [Streptomyces pinistramenti]MCB5906703.1 hypothetical protein [Streptomyces pinistramenti]
MTDESPRSPLPLTDAPCRVLTTRQLRERGVSAAEATEHCRPGGPWQQVLPGVHLLHQGPPTSEERLRAVLLYAAQRGPSVPCQGGGERPAPEVMITGFAALALHGLTVAPPLSALERIDVLVARTRRLRSAGFARVVRSAELPVPDEVTGLPVAPVPRALADAVGQLSDAASVRRLLTCAVREGHGEAAAVLEELERAGLTAKPQVADAVDALLAEGRAVAEQQLYAMVAAHGLPDPVWNVDLRMPGGPHLGSVDAYWPEHSVALEIDTVAPHGDDDPPGEDRDRMREHLDRLGITVVCCAPRALRESPREQAVVVRTALMAAADREPGAYVVVLPR